MTTDARETIHRVLYRHGTCHGAIGKDDHSGLCDRLTAAIEADRREVVEAAIGVAVAAGKRGENALGMLAAIRSLSPKGTTPAARAQDSGCELFGLTDGKYTCATSGFKSRCDACAGEVR